VASIVFDISIPANDPWELIYLAGGDPLKNQYTQSTTTLTNATVSQAALNQAALDLAAGIQSTQKLQEVKNSAEDTVTPTDLALAVLGDSTAITKLQTLVGVTAPTSVLPLTPPTSPTVSAIKNNTTAIIPPVTTDNTSNGYSTGSLWVDTTAKIGYICVSSSATTATWHRIDTNVTTSSLNNYTAVINPTAADNASNGYSSGSVWINTITSSAFICLAATATAATWHQLDVVIPKFRYVGFTTATPASTLFANIPFADDLTIVPNGFTNAAGVLSAANTGDYSISVNVSYLAIKKYSLQQIRLLHNGLLVGPVIKQEAGKITFNGSLIIANFPIHLTAADTVSVQYMGTVGTTFSSYIHINQLGK